MNDSKLNESQSPNQYEETKSQIKEDLEKLARGGSFGDYEQGNMNEFLNKSMNDEQTSNKDTAKTLEVEVDFKQTVQAQTKRLTFSGIKNSFKHCENKVRAREIEDSKLSVRNTTSRYEYRDFDNTVSVKPNDKINNIIGRAVKEGLMADQTKNQIAIGLTGVNIVDAKTAAYYSTMADLIVNKVENEEIHETPNYDVTCKCILKMKAGQCMSICEFRRNAALMNLMAGHDIAEMTDVGDVYINTEEERKEIIKVLDEYTNKVEKAFVNLDKPTRKTFIEWASIHKLDEPEVIYKTACYDRIIAKFYRDIEFQIEGYEE